METPGQLLRTTREKHGVSQKQLAMRASTTQSAISRIERDKVSPSVETLGGLLYLLGENLTLDVEKRDFGIDWTLNEERLKLSPSERVAYGLAMAEQMIAISPNVRAEPA